MPCHGSDHSSPFPRRRGATADLERSLTSEPSPPYQNFRKGRDQNSRNPQPGCYSQGDSVDEALANIREAIELVVEDLKARGEEIPDPSGVLVGSVVITR